MFMPAARLLRLLSLLQTRSEWTGAELAARMEVTDRTVRRDVEKLRSLGYPVRATPGVTGGYRLGSGGALPPLLLDDEEAVAVAVGLRTAAGFSVAGIAETSVRALAKLEQMLPSRLRHRVRLLQEVTVPLAAGGPAVDPDTLTALATACRDHHRLRFDYLDHDGVPSVRTTEPHRLVHTGRRWYLLAYDVERSDWRTFRVDRLRPRTPTGPRFVPREPPAPPAEQLSQSVASDVYRFRARILMHAPAEVVADRSSPTAGRLEPLDDARCVLHTGSNSLEQLALYVALKGIPFEVLDPPELVTVIRGLAQRLTAAASERPIT
ncbi:WYL domain-containing protein [Dactylosporangium fulvum]|uniref:YafY family transcriptional regulator n=1 Tax=Dactylosporangium fulvum TaxID=53359 RepID=A0ABY5VP49_9ACTN|nr:YafY family protein [Dactylosporangium fulvum]UWP78539.1 YafY family transcriptional regulator [Dactylosporangium fulvum]